jgi:heat shock protein HspQ
MSQSSFPSSNAKYSIGDLVHHVLFDYRGVIVDIDANFQLNDEWYDTVARSRPPKDEPWYHVLVHNAINSTYVAEQNLEPDSSSLDINHPLIHSYFSEIQNGSYVINQKFN